MGVLDAVKRGFSITNRNIKLIAVLFSFNVISALVRLPFTPAAPVAGTLPAAPPAPSGSIAIFSIFFGLVSILMFGGVLGFLQEFIQTQKGTIGNFVKYGLKYYFRVLGVWILIIAILLVFGLLVAAGISLTVAIKNLVVTVFALAAVLIVGAIGIYVFILFLMSPYILIADDIGPIVALKKSMKFVRGSLLKVIGLFAILVLLSMGIGFGIGILAGIASFALKGVAGQFVVGLISSAFNSYVNVLLPACFLLFYMSSQKKEEPPTTTTTT